jgi:hypothetical protein
MAGAKINSAGVKTINGADFLVFDVTTPAPDGEIRNVMAFASLEGRMLAVSYNCSLARDANCGALGTRLIQSMSLKGNPTAR